MSTTNSRGLILPTVGSDVSTWGGYLNNNFAYITQMFGTVLSVALSDGVTTNLSQSQTQNGTIQLTGTLTVQTIVTFPNVSGYWNIDNRTVGGYVMITTATGTNATIGIPQGKTSQIYVDITSSTPGIKFLNPADPGTYWDYASGTAPAWFAGCTSNGTAAQLPWLPCDGVTTYNFSDYPYLAAILVGTWGGNGVTTFKTPDLRNRARVSVMSSGARLTAAVSGIDGAVVGSGASTSESTTLLTSQIPSHSHSPNLTDPGHLHSTLGITGGSSIGAGSNFSNQISPTGTSTTGITVSVGNTGGGTAHTNVQPTAIAGLTFIKT
jgi:microcystin-dependent protein